MAAMSDAQPSKLNLWMDFLATNKVDETSAPLLATRCARQTLYWWRLDTLTEGTEHEQKETEEALKSGHSQSLV